MANKLFETAVIKALEEELKKISYFEGNVCRHSKLDTMRDKFSFCTIEKINTGRYKWTANCFETSIFINAYCKDNSTGNGDIGADNAIGLIFEQLDEKTIETSEVKIFYIRNESTSESELDENMDAWTISAKYIVRWNLR